MIKMIFLKEEVGYIPPVEPGNDAGAKINVSRALQDIAILLPHSDRLYYELIRRTQTHLNGVPIAEWKEWSTTKGKTTDRACGCWFWVGLKSTPNKKIPMAIFVRDPRTNLSKVNPTYGYPRGYGASNLSGEAYNLTLTKDFRNVKEQKFYNESLLIHLTREMWKHQYLHFCVIHRDRLGHPRNFWADRYFDLDPRYWRASARGHLGIYNRLDWMGDGKYLHIEDFEFTIKNLILHQHTTYLGEQNEKNRTAKCTHNR